MFSVSICSACLRFQPGNHNGSAEAFCLAVIDKKHWKRIFRLVDDKLRLFLFRDFKERLAGNDVYIIPLRALLPGQLPNVSLTLLQTGKRYQGTVLVQDAFRGASLF